MDTAQQIAAGAAPASELSDYLTQTFALSADEAEAVGSHFKSQSRKKGDYLLRIHEVCKEVHFVSRGSVRAFSITQTGAEATRYVAFENEFITTLTSFIHQVPSSEFLQATEDAEVQTVGYASFRSLLHTTPFWKDLYIKQLEQAYTNYTWRLESFLRMDASQRYDYLLFNRPQMIQRLPNKMVASYLGITQESLSRLKARR